MTKMFRNDSRKEYRREWTEDELAELRARGRVAPGKVPRAQLLPWLAYDDRAALPHPAPTHGAESASAPSRRRAERQKDESALFGMTRTFDVDGPMLGKGAEAMQHLIWHENARRPGPPRADARPGGVMQGKGMDGPDQLPGHELRLQVKGSGEALPEEVRVKMESALGMDFSEVRIHVGPQAPSVGALAFTRGTDIFFAPGQYQPWSQTGQELLGHELVHVVQQTQGRVAETTRVGDVQLNDDSALEREADVLGARAAKNESTTSRNELNSNNEAVSSTQAPNEMRPTGFTGTPDSVVTQQKQAPGAATPEATDKPSGESRARAPEAEPGSPVSEIERIKSRETSIPLPASLRSELAQAMGPVVHEVRLYTGPDAQAFAARQNARALTYGLDIFFAAGSFQPESAHGKILILHEVAHAYQQRDASTRAAKSHYDALERDADESVVGLAGRMFGVFKNGWKGLRSRSVPALKSGLRVSRCSEPTSTNHNVSGLEMMSRSLVPEHQRTVYLNGVRLHRFINKLARLGISCDSGDGRAQNVTHPDTRRRLNAYVCTLSVSQLTPSFIRDAYLIELPSGTIKAIVGEQDPLYARFNQALARVDRLHPNSFTALQAHNLLNAPRDTNNACIGTMNYGVQNLYGSSYVQRSQLASQATQSIDRLVDRGLATKLAFSANFAGTTLPARDTSQMSWTTSPSSVINRAIDRKEDGVYVFLASLANGYHSVILLAYKQNGRIVSYGFRDQLNRNPNRARNLFYPTGRQLDAKVMEFYPGASSQLLDAERSRSQRLPENEVVGRALRTFRRDVSQNYLGLLEPN